jgi:hypothetical protein
LSNWREKLEEWAFVFEASTRTQVCCGLAVCVPVLLLLVGDHFIARIDFAPPLEPLSSAVREALTHRYAEAAITIFVGFMSAAVTCFEKDRRRLIEGRLR